MDNAGSSEGGFYEYVVKLLRINQVDCASIRTVKDIRFADHARDGGDGSWDLDSTDLV